MSGRDQNRPTRPVLPSPQPPRTGTTPRGQRPPLPQGDGSPGLVGFFPGGPVQRTPDPPPKGPVQRTPDPPPRPVPPSLLFQQIHNPGPPEDRLPPPLQPRQTEMEEANERIRQLEQRLQAMETDVQNRQGPAPGQNVPAAPASGSGHRGIRGIPFPTFDGTDFTMFAPFEASFRLYAQVQQYTTEESMNSLLLCMQGTAKTSVQELIKEVQAKKYVTLDSLFIALRKVFIPEGAREVAQEIFQNCRQLDTETVSEYANRIRVAFHTAFPDDEGRIILAPAKLILHRFVRPSSA